VFENKTKKNRMDLFEGCELAREVAEETTPEIAVFKKKNIDRQVNKLRRYKSDIQPHARLTTCYFVPLSVLDRLQIRALVIESIRAIPKSKRYRGKETRLPWDMTYIRGAYLALPRQLGVDLWGLPTQPDHITLPDTEEIDYPVVLQLYDGTKAFTMDQETAVARVVNFVERQVAERGFGGCLLCMPPGEGKTGCACHLFARLGRRGIFVTPSVDLISQVKRDIHKFLGDDVRVGSANTSDPKKWDVTDKDIIIVVAKSMATIDYPFLKDYSVMIADEVHEMITPEYSQMFYRFPGRITIALTATPERANQCGAYSQWLIGPVQFFEQRDMTKTRWGRVVVTVFNIRFRSTPVREIYTKSKGELIEHETLNAVLWHEGRHKFVVDTITDRHLHQGRRLIVLGKRIEYMEQVHRDLLKRGINVGIVVGEHTDGTSLKPAQRELEKQKDVVILTCRIGYRAFNKVDADTLVLLDPVDTNQTFWIQATGRVTRDHATKQVPEVIIFCDHCETAGSGEARFVAYTNAALRTISQSSAGYEINDTAEIVV
jgi:superfamily II DNA or RNA helicase